MTQPVTSTTDPRPVRSESCVTRLQYVDEYVLLVSKPLRTVENSGCTVVLAHSERICSCRCDTFATAISQIDEESDRGRFHCAEEKSLGEFVQSSAPLSLERELRPLAGAMIRSRNRRKTFMKHTRTVIRIDFGSPPWSLCGKSEHRGGRQMPSRPCSTWDQAGSATPVFGSLRLTGPCLRTIS